MREDRSTIKGEALFLRGFQYFLLVHNYKEVPLRVVPSNEDESNKPAAKEEQLWKQAEDDLKDAISCNLPVTRSGDEKVALRKGPPSLCLPKYTCTSTKYPEAKAQLQLLMNAPYYPGRYNLIENFAENFTTAKENNEESVFELQYSSDGELTWGNESGISLGNSLPSVCGSGCRRWLG